MAKIRDFAITINTTATASMVCEMPVHQSGDLLVAFVAKDSAVAFTTPSNWNPIRTWLSAGAAGGVYTKWATSSSEAVTFALTIESCSACVIAIQDAEAEIISTAAQIDVVAAANTFTRTTGSFTTDGFSAGQTVIMSGFTNAGNNGPKNITSITGSGTILTVTSISALVNETGGGDELVKSTGLDVTAVSGADDTALPYTGIGLTTIANDCLILHGLGADIGFGPSAYPGWVNLFVGDTGADSNCVSYTYKKTAGTVTAPEHWGAVETGVDCRSTCIAVRNKASGMIGPYIAPSTTPAVLLSPLVMVSGNVDKGTWELVTNDITTIASKTMGQVDPVAAGDSGYNPFRAAVRVIAASSVTNLTASEMRFAAAQDLTAQAGVVFGTFRFQVPRDYLDAAKPSNGGGAIVMFADAENDYKAWVVGAQFSKSTDPHGRQNYAIQVQGSSDTSYANSGTIAWATINDLYLAGAGYYGACSVEWSDLYLLNETVLVGGTSGTPISFDEIVQTVNRGSGFLPLMVQAGAAATVWTRLRFGGVDATFINVALRTFQYPTKADEVDYLDFHVDNNHMGIEFYGLSGDVFTFTNCVFTSDSPFYWRFHASHSAGATLTFTGTTVVGATVTLRSTVTLASMVFISCPTFTLNGADLNLCQFTNTKVDAESPAAAAGITNCSFTKNTGTQHAIEISGTAASFDLTGCTFNGYAASDGSTGNEAIYVNISSGNMTITIKGGVASPSIRTAGATVTVTNTRTVTLTGLKNPSEVRVFPAGGTTEIPGTGAESVTDGDHAFSVAVGTAVDIVILALSYQNLRILNYTVSADASLPVSQVLDRQYDPVA